MTLYHTHITQTYCYNKIGLRNENKANLPLSFCLRSLNKEQTTLKQGYYWGLNNIRVYFGYHFSIFQVNSLTQQLLGEG